MCKKHPTANHVHHLLLASALAGLVSACAPESGVSADAVPTGTAKAFTADLERRAYIVSEASDELTVIDLDRLEIIGRVQTASEGNHMAELSADFTKAYVDSPVTSETVVVDVRNFEVVKRIPVAEHATHISLSRDGKLLAVVGEFANAVSFIDPTRDVEVKRLFGFEQPHFVRWAADGKYAYVANIGAHHLTKVDVATLEIVDSIALDGFQGPPNQTMAPEETGFADAQIDTDGILHAADIGQGRVLMYDTIAHKKLPEVTVGPRPWIVYAEHPFSNVPVRVVPNWGDMTVSMIRAQTRAVKGVRDAGDYDSNGVNYSPLVPDKAFVMNRLRQDISVIDTETGAITARIAVGGNTETASTTPDGKWIVATVSSANRVVVIDAVSNEIVKTFDNVGRYPWSVTIPKGQNYCH
jgi:DNA-binding beta-propeller fold protein YncE